MNAPPKIRGLSSYTVMGFAGYAIAAIMASLLSIHFHLELTERFILVFVPPLVFLAVVRIATWRAGYERIVFYQCAVACAAMVLVVATAARVRVGLLVDLTVIGIFVFLAFGRVGCFLVACCHGRPARIGVRYGRAHVLCGLSKRLEGQTLFPTQLVESVASVGLVLWGLTIIDEHHEGAAAALLAAGYAMIRFALELVRGDPDRQIRWGLSEAQQVATVSAGVAVIAHPSLVTGAAFAVTAVSAAILAATRDRPSRLLLRAAHLDEVFALQRELPVAKQGETRFGLTISKYVLPDGRVTFVWSRSQGLPIAVARRMSASIDPRAEVVPGRSLDLVHVIVPASGTGCSA